MHSFAGTNRIMIAAIATGLAAAAACGAPVEPPVSSACIGITNVAGVVFVTDAAASAQDRVWYQGEEILTISRRRRCHDDPSTNVSSLVRLLPGESNTFAAGTRLCAITGESPALRLMVCDRALGEPPVILTSQHDEPVD